MKDAKELKLMTTDDAVARIQDNVILGIGTGSTIELLILKIVKRIQQDNSSVTGVCTSNKSEFLVKQYNINVVDINDITYINLAIDGVDETDSDLNLIRGGGGALPRGRVIDGMVRKFIVLADEDKMVNYLGETFKLLIEVDKFNWLLVSKKIEAYHDISVKQRMNEGIPFITDNGNCILDCKLKSKIDPYQLHELLIHLTGVLEIGYFLDVTTQAIIGIQEGIKIINKK